MNLNILMDKQIVFRTNISKKSLSWEGVGRGCPLPLPPPSCPWCRCPIHYLYKLQRFPHPLVYCNYYTFSAIELRYLKLYNAPCKNLDLVPKFPKSRHRGRGMPHLTPSPALASNTLLNSIKTVSPPLVMHLHIFS